MYAVEFNATIRDGIIEIPFEYKNQFTAPNSVKVILMRKEAANAVKLPDTAGIDAGFGALSRYADSALRDLESHAWERAAVEKHEAH